MASLVSAALPATSLRRERLLLATIVLATVLAPLNSTMIAVAMPRVIGEFPANASQSGWLVTGYLIVMACLQPVAGKLGDRLGRRQLIIGGLAYFGVASLGAALAPSLPLLIFFRVQQALAGAVALPNGAALVREVVPAERRAGSFGLIGAAASTAASLGPPLAGFLVGWAGWRSIFYVNLLFVLPAVVLAWRVVPPITRAVPVRPRRFDAVGALLLCLVLAGTAGLLMRSQCGVVSPLGLALWSVLAVVAGLFVRHEARHPDPVFQPRLFRHRSFAAASAAVALSNLAMYCTFLVIPIMFASRPGWSDLTSGLVLTALFATMIVCAPFGGRLADRFGRRWPSVVGLALATVGLMALALVGPLISMPMLVGSLALTGLGLGLSGAGLQTSAVEAVGPEDAGMASGVYSTSRYFGSVTGSSIMAGLLTTQCSSAAGYQVIFVMVVGAALLSAVASLGLYDRPPSADLSGRK
jgi:EmrB/QacA subfamily drug resistance transporter